MNQVLFYFSILISLRISIQQNNTDRINDGASTSRQDLSGLEQCEISGYAESMVRVMMSEDRDGGDITDLMNNHLDALEAFHDEIFSYILLAERGAKAFSDAFKRWRRLDSFIRYISMSILEVIQKSCDDHYHDQLWYEYDPQNYNILVREKISFSSDVCLCGNYQERSRILSSTLSLPQYNSSDQVYQFFGEDNGIKFEETTRYHIIPLQLISTFFQVWLSDEIIDFSDSELNHCAITLISRLKRSMQKLLAFKLKTSREFTYQSRYKISIDMNFNENNSFSAEILGRADDWLNGNIFLGPRNRGPFNPAFNLNEEELLESFEIDVAPIIGRDHYKKLLFFFTELKNFVSNANDMDTVERLTDGFNLFISLIVAMNELDVTVMNREQWEQRKLTDEELNAIEDENLRRRLRGKKFWAIKKEKKRPPRSTNDINFVENSRTFLNNGLLHSDPNSKIKWSEFIIDLIALSLTARDQAEPLGWLCNFTCLYNDYLFNLSNTTNDYSNYISFDKYLYSKISSSIDWRRCNNNKDQRLKKEWCLAWRRIMMNSNIEINFMNYNKKLKRFGNRKLRTEAYLKDVETIIYWIASKIEFKECNKKKSNLITLPYDPYRVRKKSGHIFDIMMCYMTTLVAVVETWHECRKNF